MPGHAYGPAGQPLVLLGITGPVAILLGKSYGLAEQYDANYFTFFWWLCIWTSILHLLLSCVDSHLVFVHSFKYDVGKQISFLKDAGRYL